MNKVVNATKLFNQRQQILPSHRLLFCIEAKNKNEHIDGSQLIALYDLDNDGTIRVGFPGDPFANNMFFSRIDEVDFNDMETLNKLKSEGKKGVQIKYYHAFNSSKNIECPEEAIEVVMDCDTHIASYIGSVLVKENNSKVASKQKNG